MASPKAKAPVGRATNFGRYCTGDLLSFESVLDFSKFIDMGVEYAKQCDGLPTCSVLITPELALHLLRRNAKNRPLSANNTTGMKVDIIQGAWKHAPDPLVIGTRGELISGQHRLAAVIDTGKELPFNMTFGITFEDSIVCVDRGTSRSPTHVLSYTTGVTGKYAAILRAVWFAPSIHERRLTSTETQEMTSCLIERCIDISERLAGTPTALRPAAMVAAIVRASFHAPKERIERFCSIYAGGPTAGVSHAYEEVPKKLREKIATCRGRGSREARVEMYARTQTALKQFFSSTTSKCSRKSGNDLFPLVGQAAKLKAKWDTHYAKNRLTDKTVDMIKQMSTEHPLLDNDGE